MPNHLWILVVDPEPEVADYMKSILESFGFRVVTATKYAEARAKLNRQKFNGVILDLLMEGGGAERLLKEIRDPQGTNFKVPVLATSYSVDGDQIARIRAALKGMILKPFEPEMLLEKTFGVLGKQLPPQVAVEMAAGQVEG